MFGQNKNWNNRRESYIKPPDPDTLKRKENLLAQMKATIIKNKEAEMPEEPRKQSLEEIAHQEHFDLDSSIAQAAQESIQIQQPKIKGKFNPVIIPVDMQEDILKKELEVKPYNTPEMANPNVDDCIKAIEILLRYFQTAHAETTKLQGNITRADLETSDLLHSIELTEFEENEKAAMTDTLKEVRMRRRTYKDRLEFFYEIDAYANGNKMFINALQSLKGKLDAINLKHKRAMYQPRIRTDLKPCSGIQTM